MKQVMNYHKDNGLLNMIRRTDPKIVKKKIENVILVLVFMLATNSCIKWFLPNDEYYNIKIVNNSSDTIFVHFQGGVDIREPYFDDLWDYSVECVIPDSALTYPTQKIPNYHDDRFSLVVLKKTTYEKYTIEEIREKRIMDYGIRVSNLMSPNA